MTAANPAVLITLQRTGGSWLAGCLSNHPDIFCERGEPLAKRSQWAKAAPDEVARLELILHSQHYKIAMCKLINNHAFRSPVWKYLTSQAPPVKVIFLKRENILNQAISHEINAGRRLGTIKGHPTHTFTPVDLPPCKLGPGSVLARCNDEAGRYFLAERKLTRSNLPVLNLTYEQITGGENASWIPETFGRSICGFLGVPYLPLSYAMQKVHHAPWRDTISNWKAIVGHLRGTEYEQFVEE